ncbi:MAG TPA: hypothetical protein PKA06_16140, partial [Gemmatales bacterium]|nr:hypothetical protein [Gemmatales bacterium]
IATGFSITQVAGTELASDIYCITFSPSGDLLASGRGYIKQFSEPNADGKYQKYCLIADHPQDGAMGLLVDKDTLYAVGDG